MIDADWVMAQGDRLPDITAQLAINGVPIDLTDATVTFLMISINHAVQVEGYAEIVDAERGNVRYVWGEEDTLAVGDYVAEWEITFDSGKKQTLPTKRPFTIHIRESLRSYRSD